MARDIDQLFAKLRRLGYTPVASGSSHFKLEDAQGNPVRKPSGLPIVLPASPSDHRWMLNAISDLREAGIDLLQVQNGSKAEKEPHVVEVDPGKDPRRFSMAEARSFDLRAKALRARLQHALKTGAKPTEIIDLGQFERPEGTKLFSASGKNSAATNGSQRMRQFLAGARQTGWMLDVYEAGVAAWETLTQEEVKKMTTATKKRLGGRQKGSKNTHQHRETQVFKGYLMETIERMESMWPINPADAHLDARNLIVERADEIAKRDGLERVWSVSETGNTLSRGVTILGSLVRGHQAGMRKQLRERFSLALQSLNSEMDGENFRGDLQEQNVAEIAPETASAEQQITEALTEIGVEIVSRERIETALRTVYALAIGGMEQLDAIEIGMKVATA